MGLSNREKKRVDTLCTNIPLMCTPLRSYVYATVCPAMYIN